MSVGGNAYKTTSPQCVGTLNCRHVTGGGLLKMWTVFTDTHSGGVRKTKYDIIAIEAREEEAVVEFERVFNHGPYWEYCECCTPDFAITTEVELTPDSFIERGRLLNGCIITSDRIGKFPLQYDPKEDE